MDQVADYRRSGYRVLGFVMVDGSPACGLNKTPQPADTDSPWGGMTWYIPESTTVADRGVYCDVLQAEAAKSNMSDLAWTSIPEMEDIGSLREALERIRELL